MVLMPRCNQRDRVPSCVCRKLRPLDL